MEEMGHISIPGIYTLCISTSLETLAENYDVTFSIIMMILRQNLYTSLS